MSEGSGVGLGPEQNWSYTGYMVGLARTLAGMVLPALLSACFQVQLNGPVSGADITVSELRDASIVHARVQANSLDSLLLTVGQETWDSFGPVRKLWLLGVFVLELEQLQDDRLYLVTATGGEDTDLDRNGEEDSHYTPVAGRWRAIMSGAQLKSVGPKVSPLTEALYQWLRADLGLLTDYQILYNLDLAAAGLVVDVDGDGAVSGTDLLHWSRLFDSDKLLANADTLNLITAALVDGSAEDERLAWSRELVGRAVDLDAPTGIALTEVLENELAGLLLDDFFAVSYRWLLLRSPETVVQLGLGERYGLETIALDNISDSYERVTFDLGEVILAGLQGFDRAALSTTDQVSYDVYRWYLEDLLEGAQYQLYSYPASSFITGVPRSSEFFFTDIHPLQTAEDARDYLTRLRLVGRKFDQLREKVVVRAEAGIIEPAITLDLAIDSLRRVSRTRATSTDYYRRFNSALPDIAGLSDVERGEMPAAAKEVIDQEIQPAYDGLIEVLEGLRIRAPQAIGFGQFEGGRDYYAYALRHRTTTGMTAIEIHQLGLQELVRVQAEIRSAAAAPTPDQASCILSHE